MSFGDRLGIRLAKSDVRHAESRIGLRRGQDGRRRRSRKKQLMTCGAFLQHRQGIRWQCQIDINSQGRILSGHGTKGTTELNLNSWPRNRDCGGNGF